MTLSDFLSMLKPETQVAIGSKSAYMYLGKAKDAGNVSVPQFIYIRRVQDRIYNLNTWLAQATPKRLVENAMAAGGSFKIFKNCTTDEEKLKAAKQFINRRYALRETLIEKQASFSIPFMDREVEKIWLRPDADSIAIRVTGTESGFFWDEEEYDNWLETGIIPSENDNKVA